MVMLKSLRGEGDEEGDRNVSLWIQRHIEKAKRDH